MLSEWLTRFLFNLEKINLTARKKMYWGETQSTFSILIGLNLGYYAFWNSRQYHINKAVSDIDRLSADILQSVRDCDLLDDWKRLTNNEEAISNLPTKQILLKTWMDVNELSAKAKPFMMVSSGWGIERWVAAPAFSASAISLVALVYSTLHFSHRISVWFFLLMFLVGILPFLYMIFVNFLILWVALAKFGRDYRTLWMRYLNEIDGLNSLDIASARVALKNKL